jgi:hypothetical protein
MARTIKDINEDASIFDDYLGNRGENGAIIGGSGGTNLKNYGAAAADIGGLYFGLESISGSKKDRRAKAAQLKFENQNALGQTAQALETQKRISMFMGGNGSGYNIDRYIPQATLDKYGQGQLSQTTSAQGPNAYTGGGFPVGQRQPQGQFQGQPQQQHPQQNMGTFMQQQGQQQQYAPQGSYGGFGVPQGQPQMQQPQQQMNYGNAPAPVQNTQPRSI